MLIQLIANSRKLQLLHNTPYDYYPAVYYWKEKPYLLVCEKRSLFSWLFLQTASFCMHNHIHQTLQQSQASTQFPDRIIASSASILFRKTSSSSNKKFNDLFAACFCSVYISEHSCFSSCCALMAFLVVFEDDFINGFVVASTNPGFSTRISLTVSNTSLRFSFSLFIRTLLSSLCARCVVLPPTFFLKRCPPWEM